MMNSTTEQTCDNASLKLPFFLESDSSDGFHSYLESLKSFSGTKTRIRLPDRAYFDYINPYLTDLISSNKVYLAKIFYGTCFDFNYNAVFPSCVVCDENPDLIIVLSNLSIYCNRMFCVKIDSPWFHFLSCLDDFERISFKSISCLPINVLNRIIMPEAQFGVNLVNVSCDATTISQAVTMGIKDALASDTMSKVIMSSKIVALILQLIPTLMNPTVAAIVSFVYNLLVNCFVVSDLVMDTISFLQPYLIKVIEFISVRPTAQVFDPTYYVPIIESISAIVLTVVSIIGVSILPSSKGLLDCVKIAAIIGRGLSGFKNLFEYLFALIKELFDWAYYYIFKIPFSASQMTDFEHEIINLFNEVNEIEKINTHELLRTDESIRIRIRNAGYQAHHIQKILLSTKIDLTGMRYFSDLVRRIDKLCEKAEVYASVNSGPRPEPIVIQIFGDSGLGKSHVPFFIATDIIAKMGVGSDIMKHIYSRNVEQEFWDGYNSNHHVVVYDDFGQIRDTVTTPNIEFMEVIRSGNIAPWPLHMAAINEKASTYFRSSAIILTSNEVNYNIQSLTHKEAYHRRIDLRYKISVDPMYLNRHGGIDESKVVEILGHNTSEEIYRFTPYFRTGTSDNPMFVAMIDPVTKGDLLITYKEMKDEVLKKFDEKQAHSSSRISAMERRFASITRESFVDAKENIPIAQVEMSSAHQFLIVYWGSGGNIGKYYDCDEKLLKTLEGYAMASDTWFEFCEVVLVKGIALDYNLKCNINTVVEFADNVLYSNGAFVKDESITVIESLRAGISKFIKTPIYQAIATIFATISSAYLLYKVYGWFKGDTEIDSIPDLIIEGNQSGDQITNNFPHISVEGNPSGDQVTNNVPRVSVEGNASGDQTTNNLPYIRTEHCIPSVPDLMPKVEAYIDTNANEIVNNCLTPNVYKIGSAGSNFVANIVFIQGQVALCNWHVYDFLKQFPIINIRNPYLSAGYSFEYNKIQAINIKNSLGVNKDAVLLVFPRTIMTHKDITKHFISSNEMSKFSKITGLLFGVVGDSHNRLSTRVEPLSQLSSIDTLNYRYGSTVLNLRDGYSYNSHSGSGDCGSVVMINHKAISKKICGIHAAGEKGMGYAVSISAEDLDRAMAFVPFKNKIKIELHNTVDVTARSQCKFEGDFVYIGKNDVVGSCPNKTDIFPSILHNKVCPVKCAPSALRPMEVNGEIIDPLIKGIEKCQENYVEIDESKLQMAYDDYLPVLLRNSNKQHQRVLSYEEAIMGTDDVFMRPMNRRSSPGYGWSSKTDGKVGKTKWLGDGEYILDNIELKQAIIEREQKALLGIRAPHFWTDTLKVERRPIEKVEQGKTRVFSVGQMDYILLCRKYYLGFCAHIMHNRIENEIAVGINSYSIEWTKLAKHQLKFGNKCVAGDYKNFDGNSLKIILEKVFDYYIAFMNLNKEDIGMPWEDFIKIARVLFDEMVSSVHLCRDIVYVWTHSNPSGNPLTTIVNCLYGILLMRMAYIIIFDTIEGFKENISLITYGDDNHMGISDKIIELFNQKSITEAMLVLGMEYTDEVKSNDSPLFRDIGETTFLKRGFVLRNCRYDAPLNLDTCLEMISWIRGSLNVPELTLSNVETACMELSLHDENIFDYWIELIRKRCYEVGLFPTIHTYINFRYMSYIKQMGGVSKFIDDESDE